MEENGGVLLDHQDVLHRRYACCLRADAMHVLLRHDRGFRSRAVDLHGDREDRPGVHRIAAAEPRAICNNPEYPAGVPRRRPRSVYRRLRWWRRRTVRKRHGQKEDCLMRRSLRKASKRREPYLLYK